MVNLVFVVYIRALDFVDTSISFIADAGGMREPSPAVCQILWTLPYGAHEVKWLCLNPLQHLALIGLLKVGGPESIPSHTEPFRQQESVVSLPSSGCLFLDFNCFGFDS